MGIETLDKEVKSAKRVSWLLWLMALMATAIGVVALTLISIRLHAIQAWNQEYEAARTHVLFAVDGLQTLRIESTSRLRELANAPAGRSSQDARRLGSRADRYDQVQVDGFMSVALANLLVLGGEPDACESLLMRLHARLSQMHDAVESARQDASKLAGMRRRCEQSQAELIAALGDLKSTVSRAVGMEQLRAAQKLLAVRSGLLEDPPQQFQQLTAALQSAQQVRQINEDLHELSLLSERLFAARDTDALLSLKDNNIRQVLERMRRNATRLPTQSKPYLAQVQQVQDKLFGEGSLDSLEHQTMQTGEGGVYRLRAASLSKERALSEGLADADSLADDCRRHEQRLAEQVTGLCERAARVNERRLQEASRTLFAVGAVSTAFFLMGAAWIARVVARTMKQSIKRQVERDAAVQTIADEQVFLNSVLETAADSIIVIDERGTIVRANGAAESIFRTRLDGLIDNPITNFMADAEVGRHPGYLQAAIASGRQGILQTARSVKAKRADGELFDAELAVSRADIQGQVLFTGILRDVSARVQLEQQLSQAQKLESIGQLAAGIAHEINTPMQYVSDNVEFLSDCAEKLFEVVDIYRKNLHIESPPIEWRDRLAEVNTAQERCRFEYIRQQVPEAIEETRKGATRVVEIVRAMKQLSHPGSETKSSTDINEAIRSTTTVTRNRWKYAADLKLWLEDDLPMIQAFTAEINQVLLNLVVNAGDAIVEKNGENGPKGRIEVRTRSTADHVVIEVEDDGCGMSDEVRRRVFEPFFTTKEVGKGTGQGLAISYNVVVNHHGGALRVDTAPGEGTTFVLELPINGSSESDGQTEPLSRVASPEEQAGLPAESLA